MFDRLDEVANRILIQASDLDDGNAVINLHEQTIGGLPFPEIFSDELYGDAIRLLHDRGQIQLVNFTLQGRTLDVYMLTAYGLGYAKSLPRTDH